MSWNATRYTRTTMTTLDTTPHLVRGLAAQLRKEDEEVTRWVSLETFIASLDAVERDKERAGYGVAWVHGYDTAPDYPSGEGMTVHLCPCPVKYVGQNGK